MITMQRWIHALIVSLLACSSTLVGAQVIAQELPEAKNENLNLETDSTLTPIESSDSINNSLDNRSTIVSDADQQASSSRTAQAVTNSNPRKPIPCRFFPFAPAMRQ